MVLILYTLNHNPKCNRVCYINFIPLLGFPPTQKISNFPRVGGKFPVTKHNSIFFGQFPVWENEHTNSLFCLFRGNHAGIMAHLHCQTWIQIPTRIQIPNQIPTLYYAQHFTLHRLELGSLFLISV